MRKLAVSTILLVVVVVLSACGGLEMSKVDQEAFENRTAPVSITVFPVRVVAGQNAEYNVELGQSVLDYLIAENIGQGGLSPIAATFPVQWHRNQAKMLRESAQNFSLIVKEMHIETDYVFMVETLGNADKTHIGGVHCYLLTSDGEFVDTRLTNSHWDEYKQVEPKTPQDGIEVMKLMLENAWLK